MGALFIANSILLGVGLAMDAFSVSCANGLADPGMTRPRMVQIALTYALFQFAMPLAGWFCVHTIASLFEAFRKLIPWIALVLLVYIGGGMIIGSLRNSGTEETESAVLTNRVLLLQGVATSIDALSVGFTISQYSAAEACFASLLIAATTYVICRAGLILGRRFGSRLSGRAEILGGIILIGIGIEIFIS